MKWDQNNMLRSIALSALFILLAASPSPATVHYVKWNAGGLNNGTSWTDAYTNLQLALTAAVSGDEIWVAAGTYKPAGPGGLRSATFQLNSGVGMYGGFVGTETQRSQRPAFPRPTPDPNETVLSGDLNGNDGPNFTNNGENSYHVVAGDQLSATTVMDGFKITAGNANGSGGFGTGGGAYITQPVGSAVVSNCTFWANKAIDGGAIRTTGSVPIAVTDCRFTDNRATQDGGAVYNISALYLTLTNCVFRKNSTARDGGAVYGYGRRENCLFVGNSAGTGGAVYSCAIQAAATNCTFYGNSASRCGGFANSNGGQSMTLANCIFWGNTDDSGSGTDAQLRNFGGALTVQNCDVQGGWVGMGSGNIDADPLFMDPDGPDNVIGNEDDDLHLISGSPCIDAGHNTSVVLPATDLDGRPRKTDDPNTTDTGVGTPPIVDMGVYELNPGQQILVSANPVYVPEAWTAPFTVHLAVDPVVTVNVTVSWASGDTDISVAGGALLMFDSTNFSQPQTVTLAAAEDIDFFPGTATIRLSAPGIAPVIVTAKELDNDGWQMLYVNGEASPGGDGMSWETAFQSLQDAISFAESANGVPIEIWVTEGAYKPAGAGGDRTKSFALRAKLALYGGFAGTETTRDQRNVKTNITILSGDLNGDDGPSFANNAENSYHVVTGWRVDATTTLDGFTISGGNANGVSGYSYGGGAHLSELLGQMAIASCTFRANRATYGGGLDTSGNYPTSVTNCVFSENAAITDAGAVYGVAAVNLTNCAFRGNTAARDGGGAYGYGQRVNCLFVGNSAGTGGAVYSCAVGTAAMNCTFYGNSASRCGGYANSNTAESMTIANCIFWGNVDGSGSGTDAELRNFGGYLTVKNCDVQGGWSGTGTGNISSNPLLTPDGHLRTGSPCVNAGTATGAPATDRDGESRPQGAGVDIGCDEFLDSDSEGLPDWWETTYPAAAAPDEDSDSDGIVNLQEYVECSSNPVAAPYFVNATSGSDAYDGRAAAWDGVHGPKQTIQAGLDLAAVEGDTVLVAPDTYSGSGNFNLDYKGKAVVLRKKDSGTATINCGLSGRAVNPDGINGAFAVLEGFTITGGNADLGGGIRAAQSRFMLKDCVFAGNNATTEGGGVYGYLGMSTISGLTIQANTAPAGKANAGIFSISYVNLAGDLLLESGRLDARSSWFDGHGTVQLSSGTTFQVTGTAANAPPTSFRSTLRGLGTIQIDAGQQLTLEDNGLIDLSDDQGHTGTITINGKLLIKDQARLQKTAVTVKQAEITTAQPVQFNDIHMVDSLNSGGEIFVQDNAQVLDNTITSEGDRYLDLDPDPALPAHPTIQRNHTHVQIKTDPQVSRGTVLELRAQDYDTGGPNNPQSQSGAFPAAGSAGFTADPSANWVLDELEITYDVDHEQGSKLNLADRPGFEFHGAGVSETVYVKTLKLHPYAVLNTALQTLYYEQLVLVDEADNETVYAGGLPYPEEFSNHSKIVDIPLLGFSLGIIAMNDTTASPFNEFDIRVEPRLRDSGDVQPDPPAQPLEGSLVRIADVRGTGDGVMEVRTQASGMQAASSVAAKGSFARAGQENIVVAFDYQFISDGDAHDAEIVVKLSDQQDVAISNYEVAQVRPPVAGLPGAIGSTDYAIFYLVVPYEDWSAHLSKFNRGTYVELELRGKGAVVRIDNWDPQVICSYTCADFTKNGVSEDDFLILLAEYGRSLDTSDPKACLDANLNRDSYIDVSDLSNWDAYVAGGLDSCGSGGVAMMSPPGAVRESFATLKDSEPPAPDMLEEIPAGALVVSGKSNTPGVQTDSLYSIAADGTCTASSTPPAGGADSRANGRLVRDSQGKIYQLRGSGDMFQPNSGLVRLDDGVVVVGPNNSLSFGGNTVMVGVTDLGDGVFDGVPISDAVFHPGDSTILYVAPVLVSVPAGTHPAHTYKAIAKLSLNPASPGEYSLSQLYGMDPWLDPNANTTTPPEASPYNVQKLREIEIDRTGTWLYVTASQGQNNNEWLLVYNAGTGAETRLQLTNLSSSLKSSSFVSALGFLCCVD